MGKFSNIVSAQITGNVGSMNFRRKDGEIVAAQRAETNSSKGDGASYAQRLHRVRIANIASVYRAIALIEKRGWENKGANQSDFNMFSKFNLASSPIFLTKQEATLGAAVLAPYAVSRGSLTPCVGKYVEETVFEFGLNIGTGDIDWDTMTIPEFSQRIIENNDGWRYGDKLSAAVCKQLFRTLSGVTVPQVEVTYLEITLDANSTMLLSEMGNWDALQLDAGNDRTLRFLDGGDAAFVIHSREEAGKLLTSEQDMIMQNPFSQTFMQYSSDAQRDAAMASYGYKDVVLLDPNSENASQASAPWYISGLFAMNGGTRVDLHDGVIISASDGVPIFVMGGNLESADIKMYAVSTTPAGTENEIEVEASMVESERINYLAPEAGKYRIKVNGTRYIDFTVAVP